METLLVHISTPDLSKTNIIIPSMVKMININMEDGNILKEDMVVITNGVVMEAVIVIKV